MFASPTRHRALRASLRGLALSLVCFALGAVVCPQPTYAGPKRGPWERVETRDGITVSVRKVEGQNLPEFRGVTVIHADVFDLLGIVNDIPKHCQWRAKCHTATMLKQISDFERVMYTRIDAPWPVSDRDVVLHGVATVNLEKRVVTSRFHSVRNPKAPEVSGVVRMPKLHGFYRFKILGPQKVKVTYQVYSDPGGMIPNWLAKRSARKLPYGTLTGLQKQLKRTRGQYAWMRKKFDPKHGGSIPPKYLEGKKPTP